MNPVHFSLSLLIGISLLSSCKKDVAVPDSLSPSDFYITGTLVDDQGNASAYTLSGSSFDLQNNNKFFIKDSLWYIWGGVGQANLWSTPFFIQLCHPDRLIDPFTAPEWQKQDLETMLFPAKTIFFGNGPGEAVIGLSDVGQTGWYCNTLGVDNADGYLRVTDLEDYGAPELGVPYFGKKVRFTLSCRLRDADGRVWRLQDCETVLLFHYFQY